MASLTVAGRRRQVTRRPALAALAVAATANIAMGGILRMNIAVMVASCDG